MSESTAMDAEFDTVAAWTADAVAELGPEYAVAAACRGSGGPDALDWLARTMSLQPGMILLDAGAGVGGPSAYVAATRHVRPVLAEPMFGACRAADRLFELPVTAALIERLPFSSNSIPAAWSIGVLCTTTDKPGALAELHRVLTPDGRLGLLVYEQVSAELPFQPEGNEFPTRQSLDRQLADAGFVVTAEAVLSDLADPPAAWNDRADAVEKLVADRHRTDPRWVTAQDQQQLMGDLLSAGHLRGRLLVARAVRRLS